MFRKVVTWLFSGNKPSPASETLKTRTAPPRREGNRPEGGQAANRQRNKPRRDREDSNTPRPTEIAAKAPAEPRAPRPQRPAPIEKPILESPKLVATEPVLEESGNTSSSQGRKRGRRGGRRERERRDVVATIEPTTAQQANVEIAQPVMEASIPPAVEIAPPTVLIEPVPTPSAKPAELASEVEVTEPTVAPATINTDAPIATQAMPSLTDAGLVMIETNPQSAASPAPMPEQSTASPRRRSRPREVYTAESSEPLVMIETQHNP